MLQHPQDLPAWCWTQALLCILHVALIYKPSNHSKDTDNAFQLMMS